MSTERTNPCFWDTLYTVGLHFEYSLQVKHKILEMRNIYTFSLSSEIIQAETKFGRVQVSLTV